MAKFKTEWFLFDCKSGFPDGIPDIVFLAMVQAPHYAVAPSDGKIRVFVTDSQSWEVRGGCVPAVYLVCADLGRLQFVSGRGINNLCVCNAPIGSTPTMGNPVWISVG